MRRETHAFLELVRDAEDPTRADEQRVQRALQAAIAAPLSVHADELASFQTSAGGSAKLGGLGAKLHLVMVCALGVSVAADTSEPARHVPEPALAPLTAPARGPDPPEMPAPPLLDEAPSRAPRPAPLPARPARTPSEGRGGTLRRELELLRSVQSALKRGDGQAALRELDAHRTADRELLAERQAARILALCLLGRVAEARRGAREFSIRHPESLQHEAIMSSCANPKTD